MKNTINRFRFAAVLLAMTLALFGCGRQPVENELSTEPVSQTNSRPESQKEFPSESQTSSQREELEQASSAFPAILKITGEIVGSTPTSFEIETDGARRHFSLESDSLVEGTLEPGARVEVTFADTGKNQSAAISVTVLSPPEMPAESQKEPSSLPEGEPERLAGMIEAMSLEEKAAQMFFVCCPENGEDAAAQYQFGGYLLFGRDFLDKTPDQVKRDIESYQENVKIPMLIGVDEEGGTVVRISDEPLFRDMPFLSPRELFAQGGMELLEITAQEQCDLLASLGINVNFAPVCDISQNPEDFMYDRSLGEDAQTTSEFIKQTVAVYLENRVGSVLKHFPGYGNTADTHTGIAYDERTLEEFQTKDFLPFSAGIAAGAPCVMVSHNIVSAMDPDMPASLSQEVHRILREDLGFDGVIVTDDLSMGAIKDYTGAEAAAVQAVKAGNDLLCCTDYETQLPAVIAAVESGELSEERIDESVLRILRWKQQLGLI